MYHWHVIKDSGGLYFWRVIRFGRDGEPNVAWAGIIDDALVFPSKASADRAIERYGMEDAVAVEVEAEQRGNRRPSMVAVRECAE